MAVGISQSKDRRLAVGPSAKWLPILATTMATACASGVPVERQTVVPGGRFEAVQGEAAFVVRTRLADTEERQEVVGARCSAVSSLYQAELITPTRLVVPNFGPQSPEITVTCSAGELQGSAVARIVTQWDQPPGYWGYPGYAAGWGRAGWGWGWYGGAVPVSNYANIDVPMR